MNMNDKNTTLLEERKERPKVFENPYIAAGVPLKEQTTIVAPVSTHDARTIRCIRPMQGTTSAVISILWKKLINELEQRNISTVADVEEFERFVTGCHLISDKDFRELERVCGPRVVEIGGGGLPNSSTPGSMRETSAPDESRGTSEPRPDASATSPVPSDIQKRSRSKRKGGGEGSQGERPSEETNI